MGTNVAVTTSRESLLRCCIKIRRARSRSQPLASLPERQSERHKVACITAGRANINLPKYRRQHDASRMAPPSLGRPPRRPSESETRPRGSSVVHSRLASFVLDRNPVVIASLRIPSRRLPSREEPLTSEPSRPPPICSPSQSIHIIPTRRKGSRNAGGRDATYVLLEQRPVMAIQLREHPPVQTHLATFPTIC